MAFCCGGSDKFAPWTRAQRVPRRVPQPPPAATHVRRHSKMHPNEPTREGRTGVPPRRRRPFLVTARRRVGVQTRGATAAPEAALAGSGSISPRSSSLDSVTAQPSSGMSAASGPGVLGSTLTTRLVARKISRCQRDEPRPGKLRPDVHPQRNGGRLDSLRCRLTDSVQLRWIE